jgi:CHRD domain
MKLNSRLLAVTSLAGVVMLSTSATFADDVELERATVPPLSSVLLGGNEVSPEGEANAGDPDGRGSATVLINEKTLCFGITVDSIDKPILAHIHKAPAGVNGPIVVNLVPPTSGNLGASSRCIADPDASLLEEIQQHATGFYVNVHTERYPEGAVRGQLF